MCGLRDEIGELQKGSQESFEFKLNQGGVYHLMIAT